MRFKTSSGIKSLVGQDLITDPYVAIFELVKNSYDANANNVVVSFNSNKEYGEHIVIKDDGSGMSEDDLRNKWLYLAFSDKKEGRLNESHKNNDRVYVGSKGVGRFSCDRLGSSLKLRTKVKGDLAEHELNVDWSKFDQSLKKKFESIEVDYFSTATKFSNVSYTELLITNLRDDWGKDQIDKAIQRLIRLKNPFMVEDGFNIFCGENILNPDLKKTPSQDAKNLVRSNISQIIKNRSISVSASVNKYIEIEVVDRGSSIYKLRKDNDSSLYDVDIKIEIHYLTPSAKAIFTRRMGVEPVNYGNIFVYRNGFRVSPYGDKGHDLFGLNVRKTQGHSRNIATREILGHISISDPLNSFKETTSRNNGFVRNAYLVNLEEFYIEYVHRALEKYILLVKWGELKKSDKTYERVDWEAVNEIDAKKFKASILRKAKNKNGNDFELIYFKDDLEVEAIRKRTELNRLAEKLPKKDGVKVKEAIKKQRQLEKEKDELEKRIRIQKKVIKNLEGQNINLGSKRTESSYAAQVGHHMTAMSNSMRRALKDFVKLRAYLPDNQDSRFLKAYRQLSRIQSELNQFKNLLVKTDTELRSAQPLNWFDFAQWHFENRPISKVFKVVCNFDEGVSKKTWEVTSMAIEVGMMLDNFLINAQDHGASFLDITFRKKEIEFFSDSEHVLKENLERIFELGFSTKKEGTGIGLHQIKSFLNKLKLSIHVENRKNGVAFLVRM